MNFPRALSSILLVLSVISPAPVWATPDLSSRNTLHLEVAPGAIASGGNWVAVSETSRTVSEIPRYNQYVTVTGRFDGSSATQYVIPSLLPENEIFGEALGLAGDRLAIGAPSGGYWGYNCSDYYCFPAWEETSPGKVYLYQFDGVNFVPERELTGGGVLGQFGQSLALRQDAVLIGAPGEVPGKAFLFDPNTGSQITSFTSPTASSDDDFGAVVALTDTLAVVGAPVTNSVYIYRNTEGVWELLAALTHPDGAAKFGSAIAADSDKVLVGAYGIDKAYIYDLADVAEEPEAVSDYATWPAAEEFTGQTASRFGYAVALSGDVGWVSATRELNDGLRQGVVYQYEHSELGGWLPAGTIKSAVLSPALYNDFGGVMAASADLFTVATTYQNLQDVFTATDNVHDPDSDTVGNVADNCPNTPNPTQGDLDADGAGDVCDDDMDGDSISNAQEAVLGTDPYNPDTDGDGLRDDTDPVPLHRDIDADGREDPLDNCPMVANPAQGNLDGDKFGDACDDDMDGDSLSNAAETAAGADPYNRDSDGDGHADNYDLFPIDQHDGWSKVYRFPLYEAEYVAIKGDLALGANSISTLQAYARVNGDWEQIPAPNLAPLNARDISGIALSGTTAAIVVKTSQLNQPGQTRPSVLIYRWNAQTGWGYVQGFSPPFSRHYVDEIRLDGNLLVIVGRPEVEGSGFRGLVEIYQLQAGLYQYKGNYSNDGAGYMLEAQISGDKVFVGDNIIYSNKPTALHRLSATGVIEASVLTSIKDSTQSSSCINPSNSPLISAGNGKALVSTNGPDFWAEKPQSGNVLTLTPVPFGNNNIAGLGDTNLVGLEHPVPLTHPISGAQTNFNLKVLSMVDGRPLGVIPNRRIGNSACWVNWSTDGLAVTVATSDGFVEIYPIDRDGDGIVDGNDNCRNVANPDQANADGDGYGDVCEPVLPPGCG